MMKVIIVALAIFVGCVIENRALDANDYIAYVEELSKDEKFVEEYAKWSFELFSQPDYLYGKNHGKFPCEVTKDSIVPTSVHTLRPSDVKCVGAMGDSLTAGLGAHAITPIGLLFENRGISWSIGGDHSYNKVLSVPNALRTYANGVEGFSTKVSMMILNGQNASHNHLNVAKSGDRSNNMPYQAELLMERMKDKHLCNWTDDWKVITFFVGGNDLCSFCEDPNVTKHTPEIYLSNVRDTLDKLYNAPIPRTLVNLVLVLDARGVKELNSGGYVCRLLHKRTCPCAAFPTPEQAKTLDDYIPRYQQSLVDLANSDRYNGRSDFTVVAQPFLAKTQLPRKDNHQIDFSYFAPDCFHFSGKGHAQAALSLWNNMLEPVGAKQWAWHMGETLKCPSKEFPYIFTNNNSANALKAYQASTTTRVNDRPSPASTTGGQLHASTTRSHKHHKHHGSDSDSPFSRMQFAVFAGFLLLILILLIAVITKRQQIRVLVQKAGRRHIDGFSNPQYPDDSDVEVWSQSKTKSSLSVNNHMPKTHGTRLSFE